MAAKMNANAPLPLGIANPPERRTPPAADFAAHCSRGMWAAGAVFFGGSLVDLFVLWFLQRQNQPQWEFVAIANTMDSLPRFALALAFFYLALHIRKATSLWGYRSIAALALLLGFAGAALAGLILTDYFVLAEFARAQSGAMAMLKSTTLKAGALGGMFFVLFVPLGFLGMRRPRSR
jgi:hypothetical protein